MVARRAQALLVCGYPLRTSLASVLMVSCATDTQ